jgi:hypothetical protein
MNFKCPKCGGDLPADMTKECPACFPAVDFVATGCEASSSPYQNVVHVLSDEQVEAMVERIKQQPHPTIVDASDWEFIVPGSVLLFPGVELGQDDIRRLRDEAIDKLACYHRIAVAAKENP